MLPLSVLRIDFWLVPLKVSAANACVDYSQASFETERYLGQKLHFHSGDSSNHNPAGALPQLTRATKLIVHTLRDWFMLGLSNVYRVTWTACFQCLQGNLDGLLSAVRTKDKSLLQQWCSSEEWQTVEQLLAAHSKLCSYNPVTLSSMPAAVAACLLLCYLNVFILLFQQGDNVFDFSVCSSV